MNGSWRFTDPRGRSVWVRRCDRLHELDEAKRPSDEVELKAGGDGDRLKPGTPGHGHHARLEEQLAAELEDVRLFTALFGRQSSSHRLLEPSHAGRPARLAGA